MENKIQTFTSSEFGKVRTIYFNDEPWFVGKDVAGILGYKETAKAVREHVDEEDKGVSVLDTPGGKQEMTIINESGLYSLVLSSKLPKAKEFKHWVTSEVLPSIRKYGRYNLPDFMNPSAAAIAWAKEVDEKNAALAKVAELAPKAEFYDTVANSESLLSMSDTAKILDKGMGRNRLFRLLREKNVLDRRNIPYQRHVDAGHFKVVERSFMAGDNAVIAKTTYVKQKGVDFIRKLLVKA